MNERMRELAEQAGLEFEDEPGIEPEPVYYGYEKDLEKFAKLIVQETLMQMAIQMDKFGDDQSNNPAWYKSEEVVKKHFGVKE